MASSVKVLKDNRIFIYVAAVLFLLFCFTGDIQVGQAGGEKEGLIITILLYSGRPNPTYVLESKEAMELKDLLANARVNDKFEKTSVIPSILGYNGIVADNKGNISGFPLGFAVYGGNIETMDKEKTGNQKQFLVDEDGKVEDFLLDQAMKKNVMGESISPRNPTAAAPTTKASTTVSTTSCSLTSKE